MITYQILPENILIFYKNEAFYVNPDDVRYNRILSNLDHLTPDDILINNNLPKGFRMENGSLFYYKFQIPAKMENLLFKSKENQNYVNFWANINNRFEFNEVCKISKWIEEGIVKPISLDGFTITTDSDKVISFFESDSNFIITDFNLTSIEKELGFNQDFFNKKEFSNTIKSIINKGIKANYLQAWSKILGQSSIDDIVSVLKTYPLIKHEEILHQFTIELIINFLENKTKKISKDKLINLINHELFLEMVSQYSSCREEKIEINLKDCSVENSYLLINREFKRIVQSGRQLFIISYFPWVLNLIETKIEKYRIVVPKTDKDLVSWGSKLSNCVGNGSYAKDCLDRTSIILGLFEEDKILASIEIDTKDNKIIQFEGVFTGSKKHLPKSDPLWIKIQDKINDFAINKKE